MVNVIVVEDDDVSCELVTSRLSRAGYDVRAARSAPEARSMLGEVIPDVLVSDMFMPGGSGLGLVADLRSDPLTSELPVVFLSGRALPADVEAGLALGSTYLRKPFTVRALLEAVAAAADAPVRYVEAGVHQRLDEIGDLDDEAERALFTQLLESYAGQVPGGVAQIVAAVDAGDPASVEALAHRLAGGAANLGAVRLSRLLRDAEAAGAAGRLPEPAAVRAVQDEVGITCRALLAVAQQLRDVVVEVPEESRTDEPQAGETSRSEPSLPS